MSEFMNILKTLFLLTILITVLILGIQLLFFTQKFILRLIKRQRAILSQYKNMYMGKKSSYDLTRSYFLLRNPLWEKKAPWWFLSLMRITGFWFIIFSLLMLKIVISEMFL